MGCVFLYVIILALVGPERLGQKFDATHDRDLAEAAGDEAFETGVGAAKGTAQHAERPGAGREDSSGSDEKGDVEKAAAQR